MESGDQFRHLKNDRFRDERFRDDPRPFRGLPIPLFERLTTPFPETGGNGEPHRTLRPADALRSICGEIARILNTRVSPCESIPLGRNASVIHYGMPDFSHYSSASAPQREALAQVVVRAVEAFEPRLHHVRVTLEQVDGNHRALGGRIDAVVQLGMVSEPVCFPLELQTSASGTSIVGDYIEVEPAG